MIKFSGRQKANYIDGWGNDFFITNISLSLVYKGKTIPFIIPKEFIFVIWLYENYERLNIKMLIEKDNNVEFALASIKPY